jgi:hypothetical protein
MCGGVAVADLDIWRLSSRTRRSGVSEMSGDIPRRVRVERNVYRRATGVYEVGFKDSEGKQRWKTGEGGITAARAVRDELISRRNRGELPGSNGRLRFDDAAAQWLNGPVQDLRPATQACYQNAVSQHLAERFGGRRLDHITADDLANLVRELRVRGLAESTIVIVLGVANRVYRYAARRLGWSGANPVSLMLSSERPRVSGGACSRATSLGKRSPLPTSRIAPCSRLPLSPGPPFRGARAPLD